MLLEHCLDWLIVPFNKTSVTLLVGEYIERSHIVLISLLVTFI